MKECICSVFGYVHKTDGYYPTISSARFAVPAMMHSN